MPRIPLDHKLPPVHPVPSAAPPQAPAPPSSEAVACPLGHGNPPQARFCIQCGAQMGAAAPEPAAGRPKPEALLTDEERAERQAQHAAAVRAGREMPDAGYLVPTGQRESVLIHFIDDGFYALGAVWYRGQELEVEVGDARWPEARSWILLDDGGQMERFEKVFFRPGPWPGRKSYADPAASFEPRASLSGDGTVPPPSVEELLQADMREKARRRGAPAPARR
jgi:hypothetical protein